MNDRWERLGNTILGRDAEGNLIEQKIVEPMPESDSRQRATARLEVGKQLRELAREAERERFKGLHLLNSKSRQARVRRQDWL